MVPKKDFLAFLETFCRPIKGNVFIQYFQLYFSKKELMNLIVTYIWKRNVPFLNLIHKMCFGSFFLAFFRAFVLAFFLFFILKYIAMVGN